MDELFAALSEPARRHMLDALRLGERSAGELERALGMSQPAASKHLRVLRQAGLVHVRKDAQRRIYRLEPQKLAELDTWLADYRKFWNGALGELARHLDREV
ncbi:MAG: metalloregulator ArsR/SmtB family transcription factor [Rhodospirillales bacterium]